MNNDEREYMKRFLFALILLFAALFVTTLAMSEEGCEQGTDLSAHDCIRCHKLGLEEADKLLVEVGKVTSVKNAAIKGLYEITLESNGKQGIAYLDFAKKHLVPGPIFSLATKKPISEAPQQGAQPKINKVDVKSLPTSNSIVFGNPDGKKRLFVFTDPECPFCSKLHMELIKLIYMDPDLGIYVKMFPLKMHPGAYDKARVIMGGSDPAYLLNKAFGGEQLPAPGPKDAKEPVDASIKLAESLGITGTPTLVLPNGRIVSGFREADKIRKLLNGDEDR